MNASTNPLRCLVEVEESSFIQWLHDEGALREARKILLLVGCDRFGEPDAATVDRIQNFDDLERLENMIFRIVDATGWDSLFAELDTVVP